MVLLIFGCSFFDPIRLRFCPLESFAIASAACIHPQYVHFIRRRVFFSYVCLVPVEQVAWKGLRLLITPAEYRKFDETVITFPALFSSQIISLKSIRTLLVSCRSLSATSTATFRFLKSPFALQIDIDCPVCRRFQSNPRYFNGDAH